MHEFFTWGLIGLVVAILFLVQRRLDRMPVAPGRGIPPFYGAYRNFGGQVRRVNNDSGMTDPMSTDLMEMGALGNVYRDDD